eukprot:1194252-Prorocentrum_minimum.AAC.5
MWGSRVLFAHLLIRRTIHPTTRWDERQTTGLQAECDRPKYQQICSGLPGRRQKVGREEEGEQAGRGDEAGDQKIVQ